MNKVNQSDAGFENNCSTVVAKSLYCMHQLNLLASDVHH